MMVSPLPAGRRLTPQRRLVLQTLSSTDRHPDADQLIAMVRERDASISVATVYNTLRLLVEAGLVLELRGFGPRTRFDANAGEHDHFSCRICGSVEDIPRQLAGLDRLRGHGLSRHQVETVHVHASGVCAACSRDR